MSFTDEQKKFWRDWIDALRSGKFPQTKMTLKSVHGFCCLGVGCDVKGEGHWDENWLYVIGDVETGLSHWDSEPDKNTYEHWLGIDPDQKFAHPLKTDDDPPTHWSDDYFQNICMALNDDAEWDFDEIADWVEQTAIELGVFDS